MTKTVATNGISTSQIELPRDGHQDTEEERLADFKYMCSEYGNLYFVTQFNDKNEAIRQNDHDAVERRLRILTGLGY